MGSDDTDISIIGLFLGLPQIGGLSGKRNIHAVRLYNHLAMCLSTCSSCRKICYTATKIVHLQASFLQGRELDMRQVFYVYFGRIVFFLALSLLLITIKNPVHTFCSLALPPTLTPPNHRIHLVYFKFWSMSCNFIP